jgi:hypothetical protein
MIRSGVITDYIIWRLTHNDSDGILALQLTHNKQYNTYINRCQFQRLLAIYTYIAANLEPSEFRRSELFQIQSSQTTKSDSQRKPRLAFKFKTRKIRCGKLVMYLISKVRNGIMIACLTKHWFEFRQDVHKVLG